MVKKYDQAPHHANDIELNDNKYAVIDYKAIPDTFPGCFGDFTNTSTPAKVCLKCSVLKSCTIATDRRDWNE